MNPQHDGESGEERMGECGELARGEIPSNRPLFLSENHQRFVRFDDRVNLLRENCAHVHTGDRVHQVVFVREPRTAFGKKVPSRELDQGLRGCLLSAANALDGSLPVLLSGDQQPGNHVLF